MGCDASNIATRAGVDERTWVGAAAWLFRLYGKHWVSSAAAAADAAGVQLKKQARRAVAPSFEFLVGL